MSSATALPKVYLAAWFAYPLLVPFYLLGKTPAPGGMKLIGGVAQVGDYYLVAVMALVFATLPFRLIRPATPVVRAFGGFVCCTALVNLTWGTLLADMSLLKNTLFYAYDVVLFLTYLLLYSRLGEPLLKATVCSVGVSVVLQAVLSPLAPEQAFSRRALFFNDENQLGYYCVLSGTIFVLGTRRFPVRLRYQVPVYGAIGYLTVVSQCRGALAGLAVLVVLAVLERPFRLLLVVTGLTAAYAALTLAPAVVGKSGERLVTQGEYDTLSTRGYDRLLNYPEHVFFGAGEGAYGRFHSELYGTELHSSYGTLLFCYGLLGTGFFTYGLFRIAKGDPKSALFVIPAFVHGSAHHGLRFAFFWAMLAFLCCIALGRKPPGPESFPSGYEGEPDPAPGAFAGGGDPCLQMWRETAC